MRAPRLEPNEPPARVPSWEKAATHALRQAVLRVHVLAATTPENLADELARLEEAWRRGDDRRPAFVYRAPEDHGAMRGALERIARGLEGEGPLGRVYAGRAVEVELEARICERAGSATIAEPVALRFARRDAFDDGADALAEGWVGEPACSTDGRPELVASDDERSPRSLLCRMREELGRRGLPFRVLVRRDVAALAATGDGVVLVAAGRLLSAADVERTVLHEIAGHVAPRVAAASAPLGIFAVGTRHGSDDQEGRALALEDDAGFLDVGRRRELARRHLAARDAKAGADFTETTRRLLDRGALLPDALRISARAHRGGGLAREAVYLPALLRVQAARAGDANGCGDAVLATGSVSVEAASVLRAWIPPYFDSR